LSLARPSIEWVVGLHRRQLTTLLALLFLCGCGRESAPPVTEEAPTSRPTVEDITAVRAAFDSGQADDALAGLYDVIQETGAQGHARAAETIRTELPGLVAQFDAAAPAALTRLSALELRTDGGRRFRAVAARFLRAQAESFYDLDKEIASSESTRRALARWEEKNGDLSDRLGAEIETLVKGVPADERAAVRQAVYGFFTR
jgi:hypothetical protein